MPPAAKKIKLDGSRSDEGASKCTWAPNAKNSPHNVIPVTPRPAVMGTVLEAIGNTPMVRLNKIPRAEGLKCDVLAKCEFFNAGGSVKDRIAKRMVEEAERKGVLKPGTTIIEPTSGNTGIGLALAAAVKGYKCIITLPEKMSDEKVNVLKGLGAEIIRTPTEAAWDAPESHIGVAKKLNAELENSVILDQYGNPDNPLAHYDTTAEEILEQCGGKIDMLVASAGTGGTLSGIARKILERCPDCKIIGVDPEGSILAEPSSLNNTSASYLVEGIGYDFIPVALERRLVHKWIKSRDKESLILARRLMKEEGLLCGGSSGAALYGVLEAAKELKAGQKCVFICPDSIRNYMTKHLSPEWMKKKGFMDQPMVAEETQKEEQWGGATIKDLKLAAAITINETAKVQEAIDVMQKHSVDQLPVVNPEKKPTGLVSLQHLLSKVATGRLGLSDPITTTKGMFKFNKTKAYTSINPSTPLASLSKFFEKNSIAFVSSDDNSILHVVTKVDLLAYLVGLKK
eukprot:Lithocolla_globosa_v1_NODE_793_length_3272_cov_24.216661.p1 type:complete len:514 gc:universal NODE_793_length_3272_cov_24.216661:1485-3026(+)